tara:strand:- start:887 stop:1252 length:366 start_codon:yes stop_codon:yes gene_type:complete
MLYENVIITKISNQLTNYINENYGTNWSVVRIDQDNNEVIIKLEEWTQDFWLVAPHGGWDYTKEEIANFKAEEIQELKEQYDHQVRYYEECCNDDDCDGQDVEEAYSEMRTAYNLWQDALK